MKINEQWYGDSQANEVANLAASVKDNAGYFIEIGVWQGVSFSYIARAVDPIVLCAVDTWRGNEDESTLTGVEHSSVTVAKTRDVKQEFIDNMQSEGITNYAIYPMHWRDFLTALYPYGSINGDKGIAFLHIDASHDYESVKANIEAALPFMLSGSVMCGDDYLTASDNRDDLHGGVMRAVKECLPDHTNINNLWVWKNTR